MCLIFINRSTKPSFTCNSADKESACSVEDLGRSLVKDQVGKIPWRRERLPTPVFWPGQFHGLYSPWGRKESDTTEQLSLSSQAQEILLPS